MHHHTEPPCPKPRSPVMKTTKYLCGLCGSFKRQEMLLWIAFPIFFFFLVDLLGRVGNKKNKQQQTTHLNAAISLLSLCKLASRLEVSSDICLLAHRESNVLIKILFLTPAWTGYRTGLRLQVGITGAVFSATLAAVRLLDKIKDHLTAVDANNQPASK